jgi:nitroreductase
MSSESLRPASLSSIQESLSARYPLGSSATGLSNDTLNTLLGHRSVRKYLPKPVPQEVLEMAIAAAQSASTSSNLQVWSVVAVRDSERKARLAELCGNQKHVRDCPLFLAWIADLGRLANIGDELGVQLDGLDYIEAPLLSIVDATLAAQNAVVAFESLGLGAVYIGGLRNNAEIVAAELGLPDRAFAVFGMCVGYPDPAEPASIKPRLPQEAVLHHENYSLARQEAALNRYEQEMDAFYKTEGMNTLGWRERCARRIATVKSLTGREKMRGFLEKIGLKLG